MNPELAAKITNMSIWKKQKIYANYLATILSLKYDFEIWNKYDNNLPGVSHGHNTFFNSYYLWKDLSIYSFEEFVDEKNIEVMDNGQDWKNNGFGDRIWIQYFGIYDWYFKF